MSNSEFTQSDIQKLEKILSFPFAGAKPLDKQTTNKSKNLIEGGLVRETKITNGTKTVTTRLQTDKERIQNLEKILKF